MVLQHTTSSTAQTSSPKLFEVGEFTFWNSVYVVLDMPRIPSPMMMSVNVPSLSTRCVRLKLTILHLHDMAMMDAASTAEIAYLGPFNRLSIEIGGLLRNSPSQVAVRRVTDACEDSEEGHRRDEQSANREEKWHPSLAMPDNVE